MSGLKKKFVWGSVVAATAMLCSTPAGAQDPATVVLLDSNAIRAAVAPHHFAPVDINATIADIGVRDALPYFNVREGETLTIPGGTPGHEGWLAFNAIPPTWSSDGEADGLESFLYAGPGLGSPDAAGSRVSRLGARPEVIALGPVGLGQLAGHTVCALAYAGELPRSAAGVGLSGANLGLLAFTVVGTATGGAGALPAVTVIVRETRTVCGGAVAPMVDPLVPGL